MGGYKLRCYPVDNLTDEARKHDSYWGLSESDQLTSRNSWTRSKQELGGRNKSGHQLRSYSMDNVTWGARNQGSSFWPI